MLLRNRSEAQLAINHSFTILWRKATPRKPQVMLLVVMQANGSTCMSSVENGEWQGKNVRTEEIKQRLSKCVFAAFRAMTYNLGVCGRQLRKSCPNTLIARELDQITSSMK